MTQGLLTSTNPAEVTVVDIDMPFRSMVMFMIKWAIATIPALIILAVLAALALGLVRAMFGP